MVPAPSRTFVKICGITRVEEAVAAVRAGANAVGFVFAGGPRKVSVYRAGRIAAHVHPSVWKVGVFVDAPFELIESHVQAAGLDGVQLHGSETPELVRRLKKALPNLLVVKAVKMNGRESPSAAERFARDADAIMLDPKDPSQPELRMEPLPMEWMNGWSLEKTIIAGGLSPENVSGLVRSLRPWGVDASSGLESRPGRKDPAKISAFVRAVRTEDGRRT